LPDCPPEYVLTPEERHNLFLTVKESVNNIVRHSEASTVEIQVTADKGILKIVIRDNGHGIDNSTPCGSNGLRNMRQRMSQIGGECLITTKPGAGTCVSLVFPMQKK
jgi:signal transduction histidine kinase